MNRVANILMSELFPLKLYLFYIHKFLLRNKLNSLLMYFPGNQQQINVKSSTPVVVQGQQEGIKVIIRLFFIYTVDSRYLELQGTL